MSQPLILALEPDSQQAERLRTLLVEAFDAELIMARGAAAGLTALGERIPDLILTSALLPFRDEHAVLRWLRERADDAAHVQTVTIPVLAAGDEPVTAVETRRLPGLSLGRDKPVLSTPDSCDPAVFADWVAVYLELAAGDRDARHSEAAR